MFLGFDCLKVLTLTGQCFKIFFTVSSSLHFNQTIFQGTGPGRGTTAHGPERGMAAHCCSVWIRQGCVILHDFPHQYTGQSTPHCLSAMVLPVLSATSQHLVNVSILFYRRSHPPLPGALESQPTPQETNRASPRPPPRINPNCRRRHTRARKKP